MPRTVTAGRRDIADIVRAHRSALEASCRLTRSQKRVLTDIAQCRTAVLGGHLDRCLCGYEHPSYNSCRNRHCPKCQALVQERWIETRRERMLDVRHFHVVFTLPAELRPLAAFAPVFVFEALFQAAQRTLLEFGKRRLGATIGATLVLHTWPRPVALSPLRRASGGRFPLLPPETHPGAPHDVPSGHLPATRLASPPDATTSTCARRPRYRRLPRPPRRRDDLAHLQGHP